MKKMEEVWNKTAAIVRGANSMKLGATKLILLLAFLLISSMGMAQRKSTMANRSSVAASANQLRELYRNYIAAANSRNFDAISKLIAENITLNGKPAKREDALAGFKALVNAVPDYTWHLEDLVVDGDHIAARLKDTGTPKAETFFGHNPKGVSVEFTEFGSYKIREGRFIEMWYLIDLPSASQQLKK